VARKQGQSGVDGGSSPRRGRSLTWVLVVVGIALLAVIVLAIQRRHAVTATAATPPQPTTVPAAVMADFTRIPAATWQRAGTTNAAPPTFVGDSDRVDGKPVVLYIGAGYCPYCASARWSVIAALSRFGTFAGLTYSASSAEDVFPSTPTFSFHGSSYTSPYVEFQSVELQGDVMLPNHQYAPLEEPTPAQQAFLQKYDVAPYVDPASAGGIPFILVGGRYMWSGSPFSPDVLAGQAQDRIAATLPAGSGAAARAILANANELTATICALDGNRPTEVCSDPVIQTAIKALPSKAP